MSLGSAVPARRRPGRRLARLAAAGAVAAIAGFVALRVLDAACPLPAGALAPIAPAPVVVAVDGTPLHVGLDARGDRRLAVDLARASPHLAAALVAAEDRRFFAHGGIDARALVRAAVRCVAAGAAVEGGSTITMQLARLVDPCPRTLAGKARQAFRAWQLERALSKPEILARYLDRVPLAGNLVGAAAGAAAWFGKRVDDLAPEEAATIVATLPAPNRLDPRRNPDGARARRDLVLDAMRASGALDDAAWRVARARPLVLTGAAFPDAAPHAWARTGAGRATVDPRVQRAVEAIAAAAPPPDGLAIVVVDVATGAVRAIVGSRRPDAAGSDASGRPRSAGSTLKPFLYALAMDRGLLARDTPLLDLPWTAPDWAPRNFDAGHAGPVPASEALAVSLNLPAIRLAAALPRDAFAGLLRRVGFARIRPPQGAPDVDLALGTDDVTPLELVEAYATIARGGLHRPLAFAADGAPGRAVRVLSPGACALVEGALASNARPRPAGASMAGVAWKTGTSSMRRDAWAVGWTPRVAVVVWRGRLDGASEDALVGARAAVPTLFEVLAVADPDPATFPPCDDVVAVDVCAETGLAPTAACPARRTDLRPRGADPLVACGVHRRVTLDAETGAVVCEHCREGKTLATCDLAVYPPALVAWRQSAGLPVVAVPPHAVECPTPRDPPGAGPALLRPRPGSRFDAEADGRATIVVVAMAAAAPLRLLVDGRRVDGDPAAAPCAVRLPVGRHEVVVLDAAGRVATAPLEIGSGAAR